MSVYRDFHGGWFPRSCACHCASHKRGSYVLDEKCLRFLCAAQSAQSPHGEEQGEVPDCHDSDEASTATLRTYTEGGDPFRVRIEFHLTNRPGVPQGFMEPKPSAGAAISSPLPQSRRQVKYLTMLLGMWRTAGGWTLLSSRPMRP